MTNNDTVVIGDTQIDNNSPTEHLEALGEYIWKHKPANIVHIGDHWDFPSLSSYSSKKESEGRRLYDDLEGGFAAFKLIMAPTIKGNRTGKKVQYKPNKQFIMGNHENRLARFISDHPVLDGCFDLDKFITDQGWGVNQFLEPLWIDDVCYMHYMPAAASGKPVGGGIENKLNKFPHSFVHGHQQQYQFARRQNLMGKPHFGVCAGSFYMHDEDYRGANNTEIRGFAHLKSYTNRYDYKDNDVEFISLERLLMEHRGRR
jgi:hypothetical protein|tara:strand:+ start:69 stop:845 length:777 start_codon:yes stop_codon:yes gene_type:complete